MRSISVFCGSNKGREEIYEIKAKELGEIIAKNNFELVYGGGKVGLMGTIADAVLENKGIVRGVIPKFLAKKEIIHSSCTEMLEVDSMHDRKLLMFQMSEGIIAMPGGFGTLDEVFEIITWFQLGLHSYPIAFYNVNGYFDKLYDFIIHMESQGFIAKDHLKMIIIEDDAEILIEKMKNFNGKHYKKWLDLRNS